MAVPRGTAICFVGHLTHKQLGLFSGCRTALNFRLTISLS